MQYRPLGSTGLDVSVLAFGCGPVAALMTDGDTARQAPVVERAIEAGVNWFDTAASYGEGCSEENLGNILSGLGMSSRVHIATKVRLRPEDLDDIEASVRSSVDASRARLGVECLTLLQLHNPITLAREDEPTSITPADVLGDGGVVSAFQKLRAEGLVRYVGLTGVGDAEALGQVVDSGAFDTVQAPYNVLNPSAGREMEPGFPEADYGNLAARCAARGMGFLAIRVYAGGALGGNPPSAYTYGTKFFPLELYERDQERTRRLSEALAPAHLDTKEAAVRFALGHEDVSAAIIGFGTPEEVDEAVEYADAGPLPEDVLASFKSA